MSGPEKIQCQFCKKEASFKMYILKTHGLLPLTFWVCKDHKRKIESPAVRIKT